MGCDSWISAVVEFESGTRVELFSAVIALGWEPQKQTMIVPPGGEAGDWVELTATNRSSALHAIGQSGVFSGFCGLHNALNDSWISVTFDEGTKEFTISLNAGCPMHQSVPRIADPSWAVDLLRQVHEAGHGRWWLHHIQFRADLPW